jgi:hypothetical protein
MDKLFGWVCIEEGQCNSKDDEICEICLVFHVGEELRRSRIFIVW